MKNKTLILNATNEFMHSITNVQYIKKEYSFLDLQKIKQHILLILKINSK